MYKKSLVILLSIFIIFTSHLAFSQNFDEMIPTAYAEVVTPGMKTTSECEKEEVDIVANILAQSDLKELFAAGGGRVDQVPAEPDG